MAVHLYGGARCGVEGVATSLATDMDLVTCPECLLLVIPGPRSLDDPPGIPTVDFSGGYLSPVIVSPNGDRFEVEWWQRWLVIEEPDTENERVSCGFWRFRTAAHMAWALRSARVERTQIYVRDGRR